MTETRDPTDIVLDLRGVGKTFRDFWMRPRVKAVQDLSLTVRRGEVVGLLGPNGSGKTTTIKMILGLLHPTSGQIAVLGKRPTDVKLKERIGYLAEESHPYRFLNAEETLDFYARLFHIKNPERKGRVEALLDMVGLTAARFRPTGEYSKGMQRRVGLAQALINDPDLLILDEPTTGMDPIATRQIKDLILTLKNRGKTILLCTHLLGEVEDVCDQLVILYGGKIRAQGTVDELLTVGGRQSMEVAGGQAIGAATLERVNAVLRADGYDKGVEDVHVPRQRLDALFMDVIDKANAAGERTTGAAVGGAVAGFLSSREAEGEDLLSQLQKPVAAPAPAADEPVVTPPRVDDDELASLTAKPAGVVTPADAPPADDLQATPDDARHSVPAKPQPDADEAFLGDLTGRR